MSDKFIEITYLISAMCFIFALKGLARPDSARVGNIFGMFGMALILVAILYLLPLNNKIALIVTIAAGAVIGIIIASKVSMTALPQLVAGFHSFVGLSALLISYSALLSPENFAIAIAGKIKLDSLIEVSTGAAIAAITFSGSIVAFAKLQGLIRQQPIKFKGQQYFSILIMISMITLIVYFLRQPHFWLFNILVVLSLIIGLLLILPVGGADMPVIISMLNSYSGWTAAAVGFTLGNSLLIITGALVGFSGAILSYIMCKGMNRSLFKVIFGAFISSTHSNSNQKDDDRIAKISSPEDAAFMLKQADSVIIVPGYGMAVARSQHAIKEMCDLLKAHQVDTRFAIHPVAGRMPGHMNVLLAEADIDQDSVFELDEINNDFAATDIVIVIGANDITNPAAKSDPESPIYGMPVLDVGAAGSTYFIKRSMATGYADVPNELFFQDNSFMLFGDAKKVVEDIIKSMK